ncbi:alpha/beta hydrolase fold domain-containing protein [Sinomonas susongensis]|uniref:alpha/beta hydrolase fold domain-containing protein n=1 Tax=Sinomonas susongensis TaxID=1324851 RepID=UPI0014866EB2|nr:alpha/beta hydrolase fold domain-containing protein [Sinomonas susongensis]
MTAMTEPGPLSQGTAAFPRPLPTDTSRGEALYENIPYSVEEGYRPLFLDLRVPAGATAAHPAPVVVWVHGGGWVYGSRRRQAPNLHAYRVIDSIVSAGYAVALLDYRLAKEAPFPAQVRDLRTAARWLRAHAGEYGLDGTRMAAWGESAGAHLVTLAGFCAEIGETAAREHPDQPEDFQAIVDWYGPAEISGTAASLPDPESEEVGFYTQNPVTALLEGSTWDAQSLSPLSHVRADVPPVFIAHGRQDRQVPVEQSRTLAAALRQVGAQVEYFETDGGHVFTDAETLPEVTRRSLDFLGRHLGDGGVDPATVRLEEAMAASGDFPIFTDAEGAAVDPGTARARGVRLREAHYPGQFYPVESVAEEAIPGPAGPLRIRVQKPLGPSDATLVYFHGGGWIIGDLDSHQANSSRIAALADTWVIQVEYRLAPEHPFPAAVQDALAAVEWAAANIDRFGGNPRRLAVGGDSAGGNLAAVAALHCRDRGIPLAAQFLVYPATDLRAAASSPVGAQYLGRDSATVATDPQASPVLAADHTGVAPAVIGVGRHDFLYDEAAAYARTLAGAGVPVVFREYPTLNHGFFSYGAVSAAALAASEELTVALREVLHASLPSAPSAVLNEERNR